MGRRSSIERFEEKYSINPDTGCWIWTGFIHPNGYGRFWFQGRPQQAHQVAYLLLKGPMPNGLELDHACHNGTNCSGGPSCPHRRCVNPQHLEAVSHLVNMQNGNGNWRTTRITQCPEGHTYAGDNLYVQPNRQRVCRTCKRKRQRNWIKRHPAYLKNYRKRKIQGGVQCQN